MGSSFLNISVDCTKVKYSNVTVAVISSTKTTLLAINKYVNFGLQEQFKFMKRRSGERASGLYVPEGIIIVLSGKRGSNTSLYSDEDMKKIFKICFAASSGGHYEQLLMLKPLMEKYDSFVITEETAYHAEVKNKRTYYMKQVNRREKAFLPEMIVNTFRSIKIFFKEKPDVVICTGVLAMIPICLIAKFAGRKLIYIESFAKVSSATQSGKLLYKFADQFYVQWEPMLEIYPNAIYLGGIY